ncbi:hypothetical protein TNCV_889931 [Trichonephila clavipes]|nr:hypothetical protein TNCV_889931 [Trichonephila clavipes]
MHEVASVTTSNEMKKVQKSMSSYLDAHSNGEINNKMEDIKQLKNTEISNTIARPPAWIPYHSTTSAANRYQYADAKLVPMNQRYLLLFLIQA